MASSFSSSRIVYAGQDDSIEAVLLKLHRRRGNSAVLVANNCAALHSRDSLAQLLRHVTDLAIDLTFVCGDRSVRATAVAIGIRSVSSLAAIHADRHADTGADTDWESAANATGGLRSLRRGGERSSAASSAPRRRPSRGGGDNEPLSTLSPGSAGKKRTTRRVGAALSMDRTLSTILASVTLIVVLLFLAWAAVYLILPSASVQLTPEQQPYSAELQLRADPQNGRLDVASGTIPAQMVIIEETDELSVEATGVRDVPIGKAEGSVIFRNQISQPVGIPRGTVVLTSDNRRFVTAMQVTVPPTSAIDSSFGWRRVAVVAEELGPIGNVEAGAVTHIEDQLLNQSLIVENDVPIEGGDVRVATFVTEADRARVFENLRQGLENKVWEGLRDKTDVSDTIYVPWDMDVIVEEAVYDSEVGAEAESVSLRMKIKWRGTAFSSEALAEAAPLIIERMVSNQVGTYVLVEGSLALGAPKVYDIEEGVVLFTLPAQGELVSTWDLGELRRNLANSTREEAEAQLQGLAGVENYVLEKRPNWYDRMPRLWFRISIDIAEPTQAAAALQGAQARGTH